MILLGKIVSTYGTRGLVKINSFTDNKSCITEYKNLILSNNQKVSLEFIRLAKNNIIAKINEIEDTNEAKKLINQEIFIDRSNLPKIKEGEYYACDLIGFKILNNKNEVIGNLENIYNFGAGDIIEIEFLNKKKEMFNFKDDRIKHIDSEKRYLVIELDESTSYK